VPFSLARGIERIPRGGEPDRYIGEIQPGAALGRHSTDVSVARRRIRCRMRRINLLEAGVALATLLSLGMLALLLAAPILTRPTAVVAPAPSSTPVHTDSPGEEQPPLGLYLLRGAFSFGPCLGMELTPLSYPVGDEAGAGVATVFWWQRGMTGCDSRTGDVEEVEATVERLAAEEPSQETLGYAIAFGLPARAGAATRVELTILAARSTQELLQAVDTSGAGGQGLVFDRVEVIDPALDPIASPTPIALQPNGLYLLRGPFNAGGGLCLVLELRESAYPPEASATGTAGIRWWERAVAEPSNPAECLSRIGDVHEASASVLAVRDPNGIAIAYSIGFSVPTRASGAMQDIEISILLDESTREQLHAIAIMPEDGRPMVFDRVDSIDPPLAPAP
jgi:hypothetical protein